jgi:hypothetical protein
VPLCARGCPGSAAWMPEPDAHPVGPAPEDIGKADVWIRHGPRLNAPQGMLRLLRSGGGAVAAAIT